MKRILLLITLTLFASCNLKLIKTEEVKIPNRSVSSEEKTIVPEELPLECPIEMVTINGLYCTNLEHVCLKKVATNKNRCQTFSESPKCTGGEKQLNFCIDKNEYAIKETNMPMNNVSWIDADKICRQDGKRLCYQSEWELACEGIERLPYPYGYEYTPGVCNTDKIAKKKDKQLIPMFEPVDSFSNCLSPFGVQNMSGNVDEWISVKGGQKHFRGRLKGGWWSRLIRGQCRPYTSEHRDFEAMVQTGFRCCKDISE